VKFGGAGGRFRLRTRLRRRPPAFLVDLGVAAEGKSDCGNHDWYKYTDEEEHCYHYVVGVRRPSEFPG
jgi:hypothetical protein